MLPVARNHVREQAARLRVYGHDRILGRDHVYPMNKTSNHSAAETPESIIRHGRNAWRTANAEKAAFLVDGADYYRRLEQVILKAKRAIFIIGWDFNPDILLRPGEADSPTIGALLRQRVEEEPELQVRILVWGMGPVYSGKSFRMFGEMEWNAHERIALRFDFRHPLRASHHQKIVCIDDAVAFLGGIDLTARRWDTREHAVEQPLRISPDGKPYGPVHDMQAIVSGDAASIVGEVARKRWKRATRQIVPLLDNQPDGHADTLWPDDLAPALTHCPTGLALTMPCRWQGKRGHRESIRLTHDALRAAKRHIYLESQYLASFGVARTIAARLQEEDGPEIVILVTQESHGFLEKVMMGNNRNRLIRKLKRNDRFNRLRIYYAVTADAEGREREIIVHSKLIVIDDRLLRIGSSNLNYRSEGLDTESDLAFEPVTDEGRAAITTMRDDLLAEHLGVTRQEISASMAETGSMLATIDRFNAGTRGLRPFNVDISKGETDSVIGTSLADPKRPFWPYQQVRSLFRLSLSRLTLGLLR
ncbi:phospholipase D-like domain-containing protein [Neorhizobium sp. JUb45]|uniref:phospholipase D-like domain-containing protein n=1 Tax=Neorhizobium sp. JUb45 TaxID=2485113 RepID=UPI0010DA5EB6|nr:phospholipase D-like domain-containing protein [Neorhizobium sp. JUb45]TCR06199.1 phosphatidylserine/phosphatidylglycerophosphate/cardiolipin synthase-like enzyme [Neorhizobium sp. JUb45]